MHLHTLLRHKKLTEAMVPSETTGGEEDVIFVPEAPRIPASGLRPSTPMLRSFSGKPTAAAQRSKSTQAASRQNQNPMPGNSAAQLANLPPQHPLSLLQQVMDGQAITGSHSPSIISNDPGEISHPKSSSGSQRSSSKIYKISKKRQLSAEQLRGDRKGLF